MKTRTKHFLLFSFSLLLGSHAAIAQPVWRTSGAAVGNTSVYLYNDSSSFVNWSVASIGLGAPIGDSLTVTNMVDSQNPLGVHIYFVDSVLSGPLGLDTTNGNEVPYTGGLPSCITRYYFGVFIADTVDTSNNYTTTYYYTMTDTFVTVCKEPQLALFKREMNANPNWGNANATLNTVQKTLVKNQEVYRGEYILSLGPPQPDLGPDTLICANGNVQLQPDTNCYIASYLWQDGSTANAYTATSSGLYWVQVMDSCGQTGADTIVVSVDSITASISGNATICANSSATLSASGGTSYSWNTGDTTAIISVSPSSSTTYSVTVSNNICQDTSSFAVNIVLGITASISGSDSICTGSSTTLTAGGGSSYSWSTGSTNSSILVSPTTDSTFSVVVSDSCGSDTAYFSISVVPLPIASITGNNSICNGSSSTLTAGGGGSYLWSTGSTASSIVVSPATDATFSVVVSDYCGTDTSFFPITILSGPTATAGPDTTIDVGQSVQLNGSGGQGWSWYPTGGLSCTSCQYPVATPEETTTYYFTVTDANGCKAIDSLLITVNDLPCGDLYVPNIFSPNEDGMNDVLYVYGNCVQDMLFVIYDRWGEKVFESNSVDDGWDGTFREKAMDPAVFVYLLTGKDKNGEDIVMNGNITLVR